MSRLLAHGRAFLDRERSWDTLGSALPLAFVLALCIGLLGLAGSWLGGTPPDYFELDGEYTVPAFFSGALLFVASFFAWRLNRLDPHRAWLCLAVLFAWMGFDEIVSVHEHLEDWTGIFWQILYLPIIAIAAVGWLGGMNRVRTWEGTTGLLLGAAAWAIAQVFEAVQYGPGGSGTNSTALVFGEELGEMTGSSLFLLALLWESVKLSGRSGPAQATYTSGSPVHPDPGTQPSS